MIMRYASANPFRCTVLCSSFLFMLAFSRSNLVAQENLDGDGTIANMLEQTVIRTRNNDERPLIGEDTWITFRHPVGEINQILVSGVQGDQTVTYRIDSIGESNFCFSEGSQPQENNGATPVCTMFTNIASLGYDIHGVVAPVGDLDAGGIGSVIYRSVNQYRNQSTNGMRVDGFCMRFLSAITVRDPIDSFLVGVNFYAPGNVASNVFISSIWDEYFCVGYIRGSNGVGSQVNYCILYSNVASFRPIYRGELPDYPRIFPQIGTFMHIEYGGAYPDDSVNETSILESDDVGDLINTWLASVDAQSLSLELRVPIDANGTAVTLSQNEDSESATYTLTELGADYLCLIVSTFDPTIIPAPQRREVCVTFANIVQIAVVRESEG